MDADVGAAALGDLRAIGRERHSNRIGNDTGQTMDDGPGAWQLVQVQLVPLELALRVAHGGDGEAGAGVVQLHEHHAALDLDRAGRCDAAAHGLAGHSG